MDEKVMDLLEKILENQTETNSRIKELTSQVKQLETKVENDMGYRIKALFDAREVLSEKMILLLMH
ncbi:MAG: hypothetical protein A4E53_02338 [Pelotomaculum sp. PtaB.Bin104]|nr:MAG: hypothetical protein A4E53_02338 [Pelotomaculum sp. PtaB.Bin104]